MEYTAFKDFSYEGFNYESLSTMQFKEIEGYNYYTRIYYKLDEVSGCGFTAMVLSAIQVRIPDDDWSEHPPFSKNDLIILLVTIWASFDGMRHVHIGFNEKYELNGYLHYLNTDEWVSILNRLKELEVEFCREAD